MFKRATLRTSEFIVSIIGEIRWGIITFLALVLAQYLDFFKLNGKLPEIIISAIYTLTVLLLSLFIVFIILEFN